MVSAAVVDPDNTVELHAHSRVSTDSPTHASDDGVHLKTSIQTRGEDNQVDDLTAFINFISHTPTTPLLNTPPRINPIQLPDNQPETVTAQRKSARLADKARLYPGKDSIQLAQRVLSNKLGELSPQRKCRFCS
ncbi:unnamed protein product [Urochloa humidicola]